MHNNQTAGASNSIKGIEDIEELRKSYELPHHWSLRKEFIQIYSDKYDLDRLICLSNVFVNVECTGLTYPDDVMKLIKELGSKVGGLEQYKYQLEQLDEEPELPRKQNYHQRQQQSNHNQQYNHNQYNQRQNNQHFQSNQRYQGRQDRRH